MTRIKCMHEINSFSICQSPHIWRLKPKQIKSQQEQKVIRLDTLHDISSTIPGYSYLYDARIYEYFLGG